MKLWILSLTLFLGALLKGSLANTYTVTNALTGANGSLDVLIAAANANPGPDVIRFQLPPGPQTIELPIHGLSVLDPLTIVGPGEGLLTLRAVSPSIRVMQITAGPSYISGINFADGRGLKGAGLLVWPGASVWVGDCNFIGNTATANGGAIANEGNLALYQCSFTSNAAPVGGAISNSTGATLSAYNCTLRKNTGSDATAGAGLANEGVAVISQCTLSNNTSDGGAGGILNSPAASLSLTQCTVSENIANGVQGGGGILNEGTLTLRQCTLSENRATAGDGGGIRALGGVLNLQGSLLAGNEAMAGPEIDGVVTTSNEFNFVGDPAGTSGLSSADLTFASTGTNRVIEIIQPLGKNGGPTFTHALAANSPAIDRVKGDEVAGLELDQRGYGPRVSGPGGRADIGSYEAEALAPSLEVTTDRTTIDYTDGQTSLPEAMAYASQMSQRLPITFSNKTTNGAVNFYDGAVHVIELSAPLPLQWNSRLTVRGPGADKLQIKATAGFAGAAMLYLNSATYCNLRGLTLDGCSLTKGVANEGGWIESTDCTIQNCFAAGGSAMNNTGIAILRRCTIAGCASNFGTLRNDGGSGATLKVIQCTIANNTAGQGGGIHQYDGTLSVSHSTLNGNTAINEGGGIWIRAGSASVTHTTISGNAGIGGGIANRGSLSVIQSTIVNNTSPQPTKGGIDNTGAPPLVLKNSVVAGNTGDGTIANPDDIAGSIVSNNANFVGKAAATPGFAWPDLSFNAAFPALSSVLGPLGSHGGPTQTHTPIVVSAGPLMDAGKIADIPLDEFDLDGDGDLAEPCSTDQTGRTRRHGPNVEIGAVEYSAKPFEDLSLVVTGLGEAMNRYDEEITLREAIRHANNLGGPQTVTFSNKAANGAINFHDGTPRNLDILSSHLPISGDVTIQGPGASRLTLRRSPTTPYVTRFFEVGPTGKVSVADLAMSNGDGGSRGGAIYVNGGGLELNRVHIYGSSKGYGAIGIDQGGTAVIHSCLISGNSSGGLLAMQNSSVTLINSTLSGNSTPDVGGACAINNSSLTAKNCTITGNTAIVLAGGIQAHLSNFTLQNCLVAGNSASGSPQDLNSASVFTSNGGNFIGAGANAASLLPTDKSFASTGISLAQLLSPLANNGGPTATHALPPGSPAINGGISSDAAAIELDQRGYKSRIMGSAVDIGAYEVGAIAPETPSLLVNSASGERDAFDGRTSLADAVAYARSLPGTRVITFSNSTAGGARNFHDDIQEFIPAASGTPTYDLTTQDGSISILGPGARRVRIETTLIFSSPEPAELSGVSFSSFIGAESLLVNHGELTIRDSSFTGVLNFLTGSGVWNKGKLTLSGCTVSAVNCSRPIHNESQMTMINCTLANNESNANGAPIYNSTAGRLKLIHTTISGNRGTNDGAIFTLGECILENSIVAGNATHFGVQNDISGQASSNGSNFIGIMPIGWSQQGRDKSFASTFTSVGHVLDLLSNNGGPTDTFALPPGSPARNAGNNADAIGIATDQRGNPRLSQGTVDMGAYEFAPLPTAQLPQWRTLHGLAADGSQDLGNPSGDGVANLLKYAFNMAPAAGNLLQPNRSLLTLTGTAGLPLITRDSAGRLVITYLRRKAITNPGVNYEPQAGPSPTAFSTLSQAGAIITSLDAEWERVTLVDATPTSGTTRFARVRVVRIP